MAERDKFAFETRKVWMQSLLEDRWKAQRIMEEQGRIIAKMEAATSALVMENQFDQLEKAHKKIADLQNLINAAKAVCRKKGRCFDIRKEPKPKRTVAERVAREFGRAKRRVRRMVRGPTPAETPAQKAEQPEERYKNWITAHRPDKIALEEQRQTASQFLAVKNKPPHSGA
jgi:hypothetical protein